MILLLADGWFVRYAVKMKPSSYRHAIRRTNDEHAILLPPCQALS